MKYGKLKTLIIAAAAGILMVPVGGVQAETDPVKQSRSEFFGYSWDGTAGTTYKTAPYEINGAPGYIPFNDVFDNTVANSTSTVLTNSKQSDVGVEITSNKEGEQSGSIWNTSGNELDLTKDFHATMQFFLGKEGTTESGDGIAFVMAKDKPTATLPGGGALGIWGDLATHDGVGMPNSFAIAIDTNNNADKWDTAVYSKTVMTTQSGNETYFSNTPGITQAQTDDRNYIGYGYPGQTNQFQKITTTSGQTAEKTTRKIIAFNGNGNVYGKNGTSQIGMGGFNYVPKGYLNNGAWHQLDIDYKKDGAGGGTFTYTVTLKNTNGTQEMEPITNSIHWTADDINKYFGGTKLNWGFTGATGVKFENGVVAFQSIPGLLDNGLQSALTQADGNAVKDPVYVDDINNQTFAISYKGDNSRQSWPAATDSTLSAILTTGSNYSFVVNFDSSTGTFDVPITVKRVGGSYTLHGIPVDQHTEILDNGKTIFVADQVRVHGITRFDQTDGEITGQNLTASVIALKVGAKQTVPAGTVGGDNGLVTSNIDMPEVKERPLSLDAVPTFEFPSLTVAQVIGGFNGLSNTTANATVLKTNGLKMQLPQNAQFKLTAALDSFDLGADYVAGSSSIQFDYAKGDASGTQTVTLKDDGNATPVYTGTKDPNSSAVTNVKLNMLPYPKIKAGNYGHSNNITWTLSATPTSAPAK
jgi:hypothetical protein